MDIKHIKMNITYIYLVENCYGDCNKVYIGKTTTSRKNAHSLTYGDQIDYTIIDQVNSKKYKDWEPLETYWIEQFRQWGFEVVNKRKKGGSGPEFLSEIVKQKISIGNTGLKKPGVSKNLKGRKSYHNINTGVKISKSKENMVLSEDWKNKISVSLKGKKNRLGTTQSSETRNKISNALKGKKRSEEVINKMKKPRIDTSNMGKKKGSITSEETKAKQRNSAQNRQKPVLQFDKQNNFIKEYSGVIEASRQTGCYDSSITMCCQGKLKATKGFIWKYKN
jgi:hypothetical protein